MENRDTSHFPPTALSDMDFEMLGFRVKAWGSPENL
jgi:hypothetical protein